MKEKYYLTHRSKGHIDNWTECMQQLAKHPFQFYVLVTEQTVYSTGKSGKIQLTAFC